MSATNPPRNPTSKTAVVTATITFVLSQVFPKVVDFKPFKIEPSWSNLQHMQAMSVLLACTTVAAIAAIVYMRKRQEQEMDKVANLTAQVESLQALLADSAEKKVLEEQITTYRDQLELVKRRTYQFLEFEGISVPSLMSYFEESESIPCNPVQLDQWTMSLQFGPIHGGRCDMNVTYDLSGKNIGSTNLIKLQFRITADMPAKKEELNLKLVQMEPLKRNLAAKVIRDRDRTKILELELAAPGVEPNHSFHVMFSYRWPRSFQLPKDYWFLDNVNFAGATKKIKIEVNTHPLGLRQASVYSISKDGKDVLPFGSAHIESDDPTRAFYEKRNPEKDTFYLILLECESSDADDKSN